MTAFYYKKDLERQWAVVFKWCVIVLKILEEKNVRGHLCLSQFQVLPNHYLQMCRESRVLHLANE